MRLAVEGGFHNIDAGVKVGDVVEVDDVEGARYCALGYAERVVEAKEERAVAPKAEQATAERVEPAEPVVKRGPGRPPKTQ